MKTEIPSRMRRPTSGPASEWLFSTLVVGMNVRALCVATQDIARDFDPACRSQGTAQTDDAEDFEDVARPMRRRVPCARLECSDRSCLRCSRTLRAPVFRAPFFPDSWEAAPRDERRENQMSQSRSSPLCSFPAVALWSCTPFRRKLPWLRGFLAHPRGETPPAARETAAHLQHSL